MLGSNVWVPVLTPCLLHLNQVTLVYLYIVRGQRGGSMGANRWMWQFFFLFLSYIWLLWLNYCILNDSKTRLELKICLLPPAWLWVQSLFNNLLFCDEILKNMSSLTVSEELFLQRTARCRAVIPSLVLKSRWAPPLRSTLISSQLSSSWTASVRGHSETQTQDLLLLWK